MACLYAFVKRQQANALLLGVKVTGDAADRLACLQGLLFAEVKSEAPTAVPWSARGFDDRYRYCWLWQLCEGAGDGAQADADGQ